MTVTSFLLFATTLLQSQTVATPALQSFVQHVEREWPGERAQQEINCRALELMASAVEAVALGRKVRGNDVPSGIMRFGELTGSYCTGDPNDRDQPQRLRRTLVDGSALMAALVRTTGDRNSSAHLNALDRAARSLDRHAPLLRQPDVIERFFHHAAAVLTLLDRGVTPL